MSLDFARQRQVLPAFHSRNYRLFFMGQGLSLIGTWMTQIATIWLAYHLTKSALLLGMVGFATQIPNFMLVPFTGVLVDRWNHHRTLVVTQALSMLQSFALAALTLSGNIQFWHIIGLCLCQGLINAFDAPTRQAFVAEIVERKENLGNAIALNSSMFNGAKLVGPAIGGLVVAGVGAGYCFLIDGFSYVAVLIALLSMHLKPKRVAATAVTAQPLRLFWQNLKEGVSYVFGFPPIRAVLLLLASISFLGLQANVILPIFSSEILKGGAHTLGILMAALGIGALISALSLSLRGGSSIAGLSRRLAIAPIIVGAGMLILSQSRTVWLSILSLVLIGMGSLLHTASSNTLIQTLAEDDKRGRVMSFYILAFLGILPFGNLFAGSLTSLIGAPETVAISGIGCILAALLFARQIPKLRCIVRRTYPQLEAHSSHAAHS
jgi:MFS family permease